MARVTIEDCLDNIQNRFALVLLASKRARQLLAGARPLIDSDNKEVVKALREIAHDKIGFKKDIAQMLQLPEDSQ